MTSNYFDLHQVADGVYAAIVKLGTGAWGNAGIVDLGDKTAVFDTFATPEAARDLQHVAEAVTGRPVSLVINSHRHIDHVGGNQVFARATLIATATTRDLIAARMPGFLQYGREHPEVAGRMLADVQKETDPLRHREAMNTCGEFVAITRALPEFPATLPTVTYQDRLTLHGPKRSALLFAGDLVQVGFHPSTGEGSVADWKGSILDQLAALDPAHVVPGHGPVGDGSRIRTFQSYFNTLTDLAKSGRPLEEIAIPEPFRTWECPSVFTNGLKLLIQQSPK